MFVGSSGSSDSGASTRSLFSSRRCDSPILLQGSNRSRDGRSPGLARPAEDPDPESPSRTGRPPWRELKIFQNVVLPGHNHMTAIMVGGPMPQQYIDSMVAFIRSYDLN